MTLTRTGRLVRLSVSAATVALLLLTTWRGSDDHFPFTPFRMYAGAAPVDGVVASTTLRGTLPHGRDVRIADAAVGMRRAELEGQLGSYLADPTRLAEVQQAHRRARPNEPDYVEIRIVQRRYQLRDGRVVDTRDVVLASWTAP